MGCWSKIRVWALLRPRAGRGWTDMNVLWLGCNHGGTRVDVQRDGIRRGATMYVRI